MKRWFLPLSVLSATGAGLVFWCLFAGMAAFRFESPLAWLCALAIPFLLRWNLGRRRSAAIRFSSVARAAAAGRTGKHSLLELPLALRCASILLVCAALARPQEGTEQVRETSQGVAIEMVVDRSSSMAAEMSHRGRSRNRLDIVKDVFREFVEGNGEALRGRPSDLIGLIAFARYADTACPLTLSHGVLLQYLDGVKLATPRTEWDGTGIGDALALAAARLKTAEDALSRQAGRDPDSYRIRSKAVILLTDGEHNCGKRTPEDAAALAKEWGIKIYVVGMVGESFLTVPGLFGPTKVAVEPGVDRGRLEAIAESTGGIYREASDEDSLEAVYAEIDRLEKTEIETLRYVDYRERFAPLALSALALLVLEAVLSCTVLRRIP